MEVFLDKEQFANLSGETEKIIVQAAAALAQIHGLEQAVEVSITLAGDEEIQEINRDYRGIDKVTDVISFALEEGDEPEIVGGPAVRLLGEIIVCLPQATRQAEEYGHSFERELAYLVVHGLLHLLGYDHIKAADRKKMRAEEELVMEKIGLVRGG